ncbi:hypothetical protein DV736_g1705, partial [Chaetothyriales sp. CBS 134916]
MHAHTEPAPFLEEPDANASFDAPFAALVTFLHKSIPSQETVKIPGDLIEPFKHACHLTEPSLLEPLLVLFDGGNKDHMFNLESRSLAQLFSIVFHFTYSTAQERLLHIFLDNIKQYADSEFAKNSLGQCGLEDAVPLNRRFIVLSQKLMHPLLSRLVSEGTNCRLRWMAAQLISVLISGRPSFCTQLTHYNEHRHFQFLLTNLEDYVSRFLVADIIRELCAHGATVEDFFGPETAAQTLLSFPKAAKCDPKWLGKIQEFFSDQDATIAFVGTRQRATRIDAVQMDLEGGLKTLQPSVLVISEHIVVLFASPSGIQTLTLPIHASDLMEIAYSADDTSILEIRYLDDSGYEKDSGMKRGLDKASFRFTSEDHAICALDSIVDVQRSVKEASRGTRSTLKHRSIAIIPWYRTSGIEETCQGSGVTDESPLQNLSQNNFVEAADEETTSESSFIGSQRDRNGFADKLVAARSTAAHDSKTSRFTRVVDEVVERSRCKLTGQNWSRRDLKEGASDTGPRLPSEQQLWSSKKATLAARQKSPKTAVSIATSKDTQESTKSMAGKQAPKASCDSVPSSGLKRKAAPPSKSKQGNTRGVELNRVQGEVSFELSDDSNNDEKSEIRGNESRATETKSSERKVLNRPANRTSKKHMSKPAARLQEGNEAVAIATSRQRRAAYTTKTYEESPVPSITKTSSGGKVTEMVHVKDRPECKLKMFERDAASPSNGWGRDEGVQEEIKKADAGIEEEDASSDGEAAQLSYPALGRHRSTSPKAARVSFGARLNEMLPSDPSDQEKIQPAQTPFGSKKKFISMTNATKSASPRKPMSSKSRTPTGSKTIGSASFDESDQTSGPTRRPIARLRDSWSGGYKRGKNASKMGIVHFGPGGPANQGVPRSERRPRLSQESKRDVYQTEGAEGEEGRASSSLNSADAVEDVIYVDDGFGPGENETEVRAESKDQGERRENENEVDHSTQKGASIQRRSSLGQADMAPDQGKDNESSQIALGWQDKMGAKAERVKPWRAGTERECADTAGQRHSSSTPVPFHVALERDLKLVEQRQGTTSCSEEVGTDPTLVERTEAGDGLILRRSESSEDVYMAETGNHQRLQQKLRDILGQMIEDSLVCLSKEQDRIEQKVDLFAEAGQAAIKEMEAVALKTQQIECAVRAREEDIVAKLEEMRRRLNRR